MKNTSSFLKELLDDDAYFAHANELIEQPLASIKQAYRLSVSLTMACLRRQLQTNIGRGLVYRILHKQATSVQAISGYTRADDSDLLKKAAAGNRLLSTIIPGKKSAVVRIIGHYSKLPFAEIDSIIGLCAYWLFTGLAVDLQSQNDILALLFSDSEIMDMLPELNNKDYVAIGVYPGLYSSSHYTVPIRSVSATASYL